MTIWKKLGSAGLAAAALTLVTTASHAACIDTLTNTVSNATHCVAADGGEDDCRLAFSVDFGGGAPPPEPKKIVCMDGDPDCDHDGGANGVCTFRVGACVNLTGCTAVNVLSATISKPSSDDAIAAIKRPDAAYQRNALQAMFDELLPTSGAGACSSADHEVKVSLKIKAGVCSFDGAKCSSDLDCTSNPTDSCLPKSVKKNKVGIQLTVDDGGDGAKGKLKLNCIPATTTTASANIVTGASELIGGPLAMGRLGDYAIRNGNVRAIVRAPGRQHSFTLLHGGQIMDADLTRTDPSEDRDSWQGMQPLVNISSTQATDTVTVINDGADGKAAILESSGPDDLFDTIKGDILVLAAGLTVPAEAVDGDLPIELKTNLILNPYSNVIQVATTVMNNSGSPLNYFMGDFMNPGGQLEPFGPGQGFGETQLRNGATAAPFLGSNGQPLDFLAFQGRMDAAGVTYGLIFPPTDSLRRTVNTGAFSSSGVYAWTSNQDLFQTLFKDYSAKVGNYSGRFVVPANGENTLRRWFVIGDDVSDVTAAHRQLVGGDKGVLQGQVTSGGAPLANAHVTIANGFNNWGGSCGPNDNTLGCENIVTSAMTDEHGFYRFALAPGPYIVMARKAGRPYEGGGATPLRHNVSVAEKETTVTDIAIPSTGTVVVNVVDELGNPTAAKVSIVGVPASADPLNDEGLSFGPSIGFTYFTGRYFGFDFEEKGDNFGLADYKFADTNGTTGEFNLEPGTYNVVVSRGYEYDAYNERITVTANATSTVDATVNRVLDTTGFVSIDTHVHSIGSPDSTITNKRRILSMIAEGVDFFANTDHDLTHSMADEIAEMGVGAKIANAPASETTTSHYGHFNMWPLTVDTSRVDGGAPDWSFYGEANGQGYPSNGAYDVLPEDIYQLGHAHAGTQVVQINHFNSGTLGHFNSLGIDSEQNPPTTSNDVHRCVGGDDAPATGYGKPCHPRACLGGTNDGAICANNLPDCPGGSCSSAVTCGGGGTCTAIPTLSSLLRLDPAETNLYGDSFTALEVWIEAGRGQTATLLADNMGDWFNLMNQGRFKTGIADSDTHSLISVQAGGPRTYVASTTDAPGSINVENLAQNVNAMRAIGTNGPFVRVELENGSAQTASHAIGDPRTVGFTGGGADKVNIHVESPTWAQYDRIEIYVNSVPSCQSEWTFFGMRNPSKCGTVTPQHTLNKGTDFTVSTVTGDSGFGQRLVTDVTKTLTVAADSWVVVVVRGRDNVSKPLFPMQPQDIATAGNVTVDDLTDNDGPLPWNMNEAGVNALAFTNPLFFDDGDNLCHGGTACPGL
jgi:hypothetical protein